MTNGFHAANLHPPNLRHRRLRLTLTDIVTRYLCGAIIWLMRYKPTYGDKQREKQKRRNEEASKERDTRPVATGQSQDPENKVDRKNKDAA